jgi:hypothetical protein
VGIFDFLRRKPDAESAKSTPPKTTPPAHQPKPGDDMDLAAAMRAMGDAPPRRHHYMFAHVALRQIISQEPTKWVALLHSEKSEEILRQLWDTVYTTIHQREPDAPRLDPLGLCAHPRRIADFPCVIVEMPMPEGTTEAYFVGIVLRVKFEGQPAVPLAPPLRYFTLERGASLQPGMRRTVLCEWTDTAHLNFGGGPQPTVEAVAEAIAKMLARE